MVRKKKSENIIMTSAIIKHIIKHNVGSLVILGCLVIMLWLTFKLGLG